jgi:general secretion pathway protein A
MHVTHWGFERPPFPTGNAEPVFYAGLPQQEASARLRFLVHNQRRLGLMLGEAGWGKSLVLKFFAAEADREGWHVAEFNLLGLTVREFYWQLGIELRANPRTTDDPMRLCHRITERFEQNHVQGEQIVLLLDDADQAGADVLTQLVRLVQLPAAQTGNLTMVLTGNASQSQRLSRRLLDLVDLRIDLEPWDEEDTTGYVQQALVAAGAEQPIFTDSALDEIYRLTQGVPRLVNRLADFSLVVGSSAGVEQIDTDIITAAYEAIARR